MNTQQYHLTIVEAIKLPVHELVRLYAAFPHTLNALLKAKAGAA